jgi:hypothetical protein
MQHNYPLKIFTLSLLCLLISSSVHAEVTESNLRSAILGRISFSEAELTEMDINADGKVDVADLVAFITADGTPAVWFASEEYTVSEIQGSLDIPIILSKSFDGNIVIQLSGTAGVSDYTPISLLVPVTQGIAEVSIPLSLIPDTLLEGTETLVISLLDPGVGESYRTALPSVVRVLITDGDGGTCQGTLSSQSGIQLPSQSAGFVLDDGTAYFYLENNALLPSIFAVSASGDGVNSLVLDGSASGSFTAPVLDDREVYWQISFSGSSLDNGFFTADYSLSYDQGLTASSLPFVMQGKIRCNMLE